MSAGDLPGQAHLSDQIVSREALRRSSKRTVATFDTVPVAETRLIVHDQLLRPSSPPTSLLEAGEAALKVQEALGHLAAERGSAEADSKSMWKIRSSKEYRDVDKGVCHCPTALLFCEVRCRCH